MLGQSFSCSTQVCAQTERKITTMQLTVSAQSCITCWKAWRILEYLDPQPTDLSQEISQLQLQSYGHCLQLGEIENSPGSVSSCCPGSLQGWGLIFLLWWGPLRDKELLKHYKVIVSKTDGTLTTYRELFDMSFVTVCKVFPLQSWENWNSERASIQSSKSIRIWVRVAWLQGAQAWALVKPHSSPSTTMHEPAGLQRTSHTLPSPHTHRIAPPQRATALRNADTGSDPLWGIQCTNN